MTYSINAFGGIVRDADGVCIPADPANTDYEAYLAWVAAGNTATAPVVSLADVQASKVAELSSACNAAIMAGFASSALGTAYSYPAKPTDQQNLSASVLASLLPGLPSNWTTPFWCADSSGTWAFVQHTAAQIQQVGADGKNAILAAMSKNAALTAEVTAATTVSQVQAITW